MSTNSDEEDPFAPENVGYILFTQQARIYDVLMAILTSVDSTAANRLLQAHHNGDFLGPSPHFSGRFYTDISAHQEKSQENSE